MRRIYLQKIKQHDMIYYIGKADPRDLVRIAAKIEVSTPQDAQRPLNGRRVKEIASFVDRDSGLLPNTLVIASNDPKLKVCSLDISDDTGAVLPLYYIEFPVTDAEFKQYKGTLDIMDGQHRLYSFADEYRSLKDDEAYEIGFTLFLTPTLSEQRKIFMVCNEKQEKVSGNLLMWFKEKLDMLSGPELTFYPLVSSLNTENASPLKDRIIMGGETVKNGIKAQQLIRVLDMAKIQNLTAKGTVLTNDQRFNLICTYLRGWENVCDFNLAHPNGKTDGAAFKISGIRYMLLLLPTFFDRSISEKKKFNEKFVEDTLKAFISSKGIPFSEFFTFDAHRPVFKSETATREFAEASIIDIKSMGSESFDPFE